MHYSSFLTFSSLNFDREADYHLVSPLEIFDKFLEQSGSANHFEISMFLSMYYNFNFWLIGVFGNSSPTSTFNARLPEEKAWLGTTVNYVKWHEILK